MIRAAANLVGGPAGLQREVPWQPAPRGAGGRPARSLTCRPMSRPDTPPAAPANASPLPPTDDLDRRLRWRVLPILGFLVMLVGLGTMATVSLFVRGQSHDGLPDDADVRAAHSLLEGRVPFSAGELRFASALVGSFAEAADDGAGLRLLDARLMVARARDRRPFDPRLAAFDAHLLLFEGELARAERRYEEALILPGYCAEAHLGYGVALALDALTRTDEREVRALRLRALGQLVAVRADQPAFAAALYDRALLLAAVEREAEARLAAAQYLAHDSTSTWAARLKERFGG